DTMARETSRAVFACVSILLVAAVAGCSEFSLWGKPDKPIDPNVYPENYKKDVLAYLKAHPAEMLNVREASISAPALRQFGSENRFFACLRVSGPDWRKDKTVIFYSGGINQFIDAEGDQCSAAPHLPRRRRGGHQPQKGSKKKPELLPPPLEAPLFPPRPPHRVSVTFPSKWQHQILPRRNNLT